MIDASLPYRAGTAGQFSLADIAGQVQQLRLNDRTADQRDRQLDQQDRSFELQMQEHTARLDEAQREAAAKGLEDIAAAVQWAQTPEQWAIVQQHYGQIDPQLATVPFEQREQVLVTTGRMKDYLEANKPEIRAIEPGGGLYSVTTQGRVNELVRANPGTAEPFTPVAGGPQPGQVVGGFRFKGGNPNDRNAWEPATAGGAGPGQQGFRPLGLNGETITSTYRTPAHNRSVGGVANSYHTRRGPDGRPLARDSVPPRGMDMQTYYQRLRALNPSLDVLFEGDHVHMEPR